MACAAIVPAAGRGERFGGMKLAAMLRGEPLLTHTLRCLLDGGVTDVVLVTAPGADLAHIPLASDPRVRHVANPNPSRGMFSSIQAGLAEIEADPILILPGDMPFVSAATVALVVQEAIRSGTVVSPSHDGKRGHPIALPGRLRPEILTAGVDATLASVLERCGDERRALDVDDPGVLQDVDVVSDLSRD
jgi:molybdenum cofactor cytidylyltransferase